ncbi:GIY-YIG nuclease family protein [Stenotrophomonas acidaminiphila]|uniref:GIY-YIG nuclease family protein n=1 Tax=Stenotrophomonas acidaminiphila TaxID=128780 RepID=UPI003D07B735
MDKHQRRQQIADYKRRATRSGIYHVRCTASGESWAGPANDLSTIGNRLWFTLRLGNHPHRRLQQAWNLHGAEAFQWHDAHVLEHAPDLHDFERARRLQDALAEVCRRTGATALR